MVKIVPVTLSNGNAIGISIEYPKTKLLSISTSSGYIMCGILNVEALDKLHPSRQIIAARVTGVTDFNDLLDAEIKECTKKAIEIGIRPGITGREALEKMIEFDKKQNKNMKSVAKISRDVVMIAREVKGTCAAGIMPGDKVYFSGANVVLEKTDKICAYALCNVMPVIFACRLGVDFDKIGIAGRLWQCVDPGPPYTPGGTVLFEVLPAEKIKEGDS